MIFAVDTATQEAVITFEGDFDRATLINALDLLPSEDADKPFAEALAQQLRQYAATGETAWRGALRWREIDAAVAALRRVEHPRAQEFDNAVGWHRGA